MGPEIVIAMYRPKTGGETRLLDLVGRHLPTLRRLDLVTERPSILCRAADGTLLEIFEWRSNDAARRAHEAHEVASLWEQMVEVADFPPLQALPEAGRRFPHFAPLPQAGASRER